jgi:hypothetical protein
MIDRVDDELWEHFAPLWIDLRESAPGLLLAGGYALFLKQLWLASELREPRSANASDSAEYSGIERSSSEPRRTIVPIEQWVDETPRVTKDVDFLTTLDLIANEDERRRFGEILASHHFKPVEGNEYWQFQRNLEDGRSIVIDLHACPPTEPRRELKVDARRIRARDATGGAHLHAHANPEAIGSELHAFTFEHEGVNIATPNPITMSIMKLIAAADRRVKSNDPKLSVEERTFHDLQAQKHIVDVGRIVAMTTLAERDNAQQVIDAIRSHPSYAAARAAYSDLLGSSASWGSQYVSAIFVTSDWNVVRDILPSWFG